jgi:hypothetical protein
MVKKNKLHYIPALSSGMFLSCMKSNEKISGQDYTYRYYSNNPDEFPERYKYPFHLISAGHQYKKPNILQELGMDPKEVFVIGDSGGYQISSGALTFKKELVEQIFEWLENNSTVAMNLDIPPRMKMAGKFDECLALSKVNYKYFSDNQRGQTKFLNVIQGGDYDSYKKWYDGVKGFDFHGWGLGSAIGIHKTLAALIVLKEGGEFKKNTKQYVHLLGTNRIIDFLYLEKIQQVLNNMGADIQITCDSSSPSRISAFGNIYTGFSLKELRYQSLSFSNKNTYDPTKRYPLFNQFDREMLHTLKLDIFPDKWSGPSYYPMVLHNLYVVLDAHQTINTLIDTDPLVQKELLPATVWQTLNAIEEVLTSNDSLTVYNKYKQLFNKVEIDFNINEAPANIESFFEFE